MINISKIIISFLAAVIIAVSVKLCRSDIVSGMPQIADSDPLSIIFGDIKMLIGRKMIKKADEYFHGGVTDMNCSLESEHEEADKEGLDNEECHNPDCHHEHHHHHHEEEASKVPYVHVPAPWSFVTTAIRLPDIERHLEGESTREMLPWLWAACRVDSDNISAYANAAYVLSAMYNDQQKALAALDQGIAANPNSSELEFQRAQLLLKELNRTEDAKNSFKSVIEKTAHDKAEDHELIALRAIGYLGNIAAKENDFDNVKKYYEQALAISPYHTITAQLSNLLKKAEK